MENSEQQLTAGWRKPPGTIGGSETPGRPWYWGSLCWWPWPSRSGATLLWPSCSWPWWWWWWWWWSACEEVLLATMAVMAHKGRACSRVAAPNGRARDPTRRRGSVCECKETTKRKRGLRCPTKRVVIVKTGGAETRVVATSDYNGSNLSTPCRPTKLRTHFGPHATNPSRLRPRIATSRTCSTRRPLSHLSSGVHIQAATPKNVMAARMTHAKLKLDRSDDTGNWYGDKSTAIRNPKQDTSEKLVGLIH
jgi:hypothetical protein